MNTAAVAAALTLLFAFPRRAPVSPPVSPVPVSPPSARSTAADGLMFEMRLDKETVMRGEPIVLTHRTRTLPSQPTSWSHAQDWLEIVLEDAAGTPVPLPKDPRRPGSQHSRSAFYSEAGYGITEGFYVVSQWIVPPRAGAYRLRVTASLPYTMDPAILAAARESFTASSRRNRRMFPFTPVRHDQQFAKEFVFPLVVTRADGHGLAAIAKNLAETALAPDPPPGTLQSPPGVGWARSKALECLFTMPETTAFPVWRALATDARIRPGQMPLLTDLLAAQRTKNAANLLAEVWGQPGDPHFDWIRACLTRMHEKGSPALQRHVEDLFRRRNLPLPR